jgi:hypothetical protein
MNIKVKIVIADPCLHRDRLYRAIQTFADLWIPRSSRGMTGFLRKFLYLGQNDCSKGPCNFLDYRNCNSPAKGEINKGVQQIKIL